MYIDDCIVGTKKIFDCDSSDVFNLGSDEQVSINQLIDIIESFTNTKVKRRYVLDKPKGVRGRSSDNTKILEKLSWSPKISLKEGLQKTYNWTFDQISLGSNNNRFTRF
jgi:nucleoside-diphosphate-sugar epimerase